MSAYEALRALIDTLLNPLNPPALPQDQQHELQLRGIVALLEESAAGTDLDEGERLTVIDVLGKTAAANPSAGPREQAFRALVRLASTAGPAAGPAVDALYRLALEDERLAARQIITAEGWQPSRLALRALFDWFSDQPFPHENLPLLTRGFFEEASPSLQRRMLSSAQAVSGAANWVRIVSAALEDTVSAWNELAGRYPSFTPTERAVLLEQLDRLVQAGSQAACSALSLLFILHEDPRARELVLARGCLPEDAQQRALFYFLAEAWPEYTDLDFDHRLLANAYEEASRSLRRRLLEHSRRTGQMDWLRDAGLSGTARWIGDLTDADWEQALRRLLEREQYGDLWQLAQVAPPVWSAAVLDRLAESGWSPDSGEERTGFQTLRELAQACLAAPLALRPKQVIQAYTGLASLALHPDGKLLAGGAGGGDQRILLWSLPDANPRSPLIGPVSLNRAIAFSPDGELLSAASGDHRIRIFRLKGGQVIKTLEGHQAMIRSLAVHPDGRTLYSAGFDGAIRFWRFPYGPELKTLRADSGEIFSMVMGAGGSHLISGGVDCLGHVWSLPEGASARELPGHLDTITGLAASPASELVASAGRDGTVRVWNFTSGGLVRAFENNGAPITTLCLHSNDQVLIGGRSSGEITFWSLSTGKVLDQVSAHQQSVVGLVLSPQGDRLYSADSGGVINVFDLRTLLAIRLPGELSRPGAAAELEALHKQVGRAGSDRLWLRFSAGLARWRQRFDIELAEPNAIQVGEFDIEL